MCSSDLTAGIRASVSHVEMELLLAVALVVLVILIFLHNARATVIASLAVPISLIGTCGVMYLLGYSLNNLSLMALTIATGFVVDDAIVMLENISRHIEDGEAPMAAALRGAGEIGFTILSLTLSLIAVLIPLLFMGDIVGRLFREFAATLTITITGSNDAPTANNDEGGAVTEGTAATASGTLSNNVSDVDNAGSVPDDLDFKIGRTADLLFANVGKVDADGELVNIGGHSGTAAGLGLREIGGHF